MTEHHTPLLIVGAGMTGLMAAASLAEHGIRPLVVDKGRSVGGRMATRRVEGGLADHGAQFFTVRSSRFAAHVARWQAADVVYRWGQGFSDGSLGEATDGHPRYAVHGGMNALTKYLVGELAASADIRPGVALTSIVADDFGWWATDSAGEVYRSKALLMTPPVPQSLALVGNAIHEGDRATLERITIAPCLCGMFKVEGETTLPTPGAVQRADAEITWIADNQRKGISPGARIITVHAGPVYSRLIYDWSEADVLDRMEEELEQWLAPESRIVHREYKRWRYALPTVLHPERTLVAADVPLLVFAGDAFMEARVEGAALSGLAAAEVLLARLR
jgi:predicted NAD/FAD-dependent oxidoreductase